ncbi:hypothetical protein HDU97_006755 [Phlyctochytrium planicorne]|nr:hypothetical protein HDU97_006755 [Phlyctochytrium planicorne]
MARLMDNHFEVNDQITLDLCGDPRITKEAVEAILLDVYDPSENGRSSRIDPVHLMSTLAASCFFELEDLADFCTQRVIETLSLANVMVFAKELDQLRPSAGLVRLTSYGPDHQYHQLLKSNCSKMHSAILSYLCQSVNWGLSCESQQHVDDLFHQMPILWFQRVLECDLLAVTSEFRRYELLKRTAYSRRKHVRESDDADSGNSKGSQSDGVVGIIGSYLKTDIGSSLMNLSGLKRKKILQDSTSSKENVKVPCLEQSGKALTPKQCGTYDDEGVSKNAPLAQRSGGLLNLYGNLGGPQTNLESSEDKVITTIFESGIRYIYMSFSELENVKADGIVPDQGIMKCFWVQAELANNSPGHHLIRSLPSETGAQTQKPFRFAARFRKVNEFFNRPSPSDGQQYMISESVKCAGIEYRVLLSCTEENDDAAGGEEGVIEKKRVLKAHLQRQRSDSALQYVPYNIYIFDIASFRLEKDRWRSFDKPATACDADGSGFIKPFPFPLLNPEGSADDIDGDLWLLLTLFF